MPSARAAPLGLLTPPATARAAPSHNPHSVAQQVHQQQEHEQRQTVGCNSVARAESTLTVRQPLSQSVGHQALQTIERLQQYQHEVTTGPARLSEHQHSEHSERAVVPPQPSNPSVNRSLGQQRRRERERQEHQQTVGPQPRMEPDPACEYFSRF